MKKQAVQKPTHSECCDVMDLVLDRADGSTRGMGRSLAFNFKTGAESYPTIITFRRGKKGDKYPQYRDTRYAEVSYCPFCGKRQSRGPGGP